MKTTKILLALCILALAVLLFITSRKSKVSETDKESIVVRAPAPAIRGKINGTMVGLPPGESL